MGFRCSCSRPSRDTLKDHTAICTLVPACPTLARYGGVPCRLRDGWDYIIYTPSFHPLCRAVPCPGPHSQARREIYTITRVNERVQRCSTTDHFVNATYPVAHFVHSHACFFFFAKFPPNPSLSSSFLLNRDLFDAFLSRLGRKTGGALRWRRRPRARQETWLQRCYRRDDSTRSDVVSVIVLLLFRSLGGGTGSTRNRYFTLLTTAV